MNDGNCDNHHYASELLLLCDNFKRNVALLPLVPLVKGVMGVKPSEAEALLVYKRSMEATHFSEVWKHKEIRY